MQVRIARSARVAGKADQFAGPRAARPFLHDIEILDGTYVFADFSASMLLAVLIDDGVAVDERILLDDVPAVVSLGVDHDGEILVISLAGDVTRVTRG